MLEIGSTEISAGNADLEVDLGITSRTVLFRVVHCHAREDTGDSPDHGSRDGPWRPRKGTHGRAREAS
jgi:hypothetical protein